MVGRLARFAINEWMNHIGIVIGIWHGSIIICSNEFLSDLSDRCLWMFRIRALVCRSLHHRQDLHPQNCALLCRSLHLRQDLHRTMRKHFIFLVAMFCQLAALRQVLPHCRRVHYLQDVIAVCLPAVVRIQDLFLLAMFCQVPALRQVCAALSMPVVLETTTNGFRSSAISTSGAL